MFSKEQQQNILVFLDTIKDCSVEEFLSNHLSDLPILKNGLRFHEWRYYILSDPIITDYEYDRLFKLLKDIETIKPELTSPDSPTQRIAKNLNESFQEIDHIVPMLSLENSYDAKDLNDWDTRIKNEENFTNIEYVAEPKFDGGGISLVYKNDKLIKGVTRGNGVVGEDITANTKMIKTIPLSANFSKYNIHTIEIRGEVVIEKEKFQNY